ncbi:MAG: RDD family protein [Ilumatobacter sp.]
MFTSTLRFGDGSTVSLQRTTVVGRAPASAPAVVAGLAEQLALDDDSQLSRHHLQLTVDGAGVSVMDLGSGNGTIVERSTRRHELVAMEPMELRSGDVIVFGRQRVILGLDAEFDATVIVGGDVPDADAASNDPTPPRSPAPTPAPVSEPAPAPVPATSVLPPQPAPPQPAPPQPAPPQPAPPVAAGGFVPGRADHAAGQPGFAPGRAVAPAGAGSPFVQSPQPQGGGYQVSTTPATFGARLWGTILDAFIYGFLMVVLIALTVGGFFIHPILGSLVGFFGYFGLFFLYWRQLATTGQTWGRRIAKVRVVGARTGMPIGYWKTFLRFFVANISGSVFYLGYLWMLWDDKQQTWHDKAAGSVVVAL